METKEEKKILYAYIFYYEKYLPKKFNAVCLCENENRIENRWRIPLPKKEKKNRQAEYKQEVDK